MRFVFLPVDCCPFHGRSLEERPIGGTETAIIRLSEALDSLGHEVFVVTPLKHFPQTKPIYLTYSAAKHLPAIDIVITIRGLEGLFYSLKGKKNFFWSGDAWTNRHTFGIGDKRYSDKIDAFLAVSDWQAKTLCVSSGFPLSKTYIMRNGINTSLFDGEEIRKRKRLIYTSNPSRGMIYLPQVYKHLKPKHPDLEIHIFSGGGIYDWTWPPSNPPYDENEKWFDLIKKLPGCYCHGIVIQKLLAREFMKSAIWAYPTDFEETSCISAMEAQAAGCAIVTSNLAALKETVGDAGILIDGPVSDRYIAKYVEACDAFLSDDSLFNKYSAIGKARSPSFDWKRRAEGLLDYLREKHGMS